MRHTRQATRNQKTHERAAGVCAAGVRAAGVRAAGVRAAGVRAAGIRAAGVRAASGRRPCGRRPSGCGVRAAVASERLASERLASERPVSERPASERPVSDRPASDARRRRDEDSASSVARSRPPSTCLATDLRREHAGPGVRAMSREHAARERALASGSGAREARGAGPVHQSGGTLRAGRAVAGRTLVCFAGKVDAPRACRRVEGVASLRGNLGELAGPRL
jgi:hypothetical protein